MRFLILSLLGLMAHSISSYANDWESIDISSIKAKLPTVIAVSLNNELISKDGDKVSAWFRFDSAFISGKLKGKVLRGFYLTEFSCNDNTKIDIKSYSCGIVGSGDGCIQLPAPENKNPNILARTPNYLVLNNLCNKQNVGSNLSKLIEYTPAFEGK